MSGLDSILLITVKCCCCAVCLPKVEKVFLKMLCHAGIPQEAPERLVDAIRRAHGGLKDDTSVIVLDLLPPGRTWPSITGRKTASRQSAACLCFSPCAPAAEGQKIQMQLGLRFAAV